MEQNNSVAAEFDALDMNNYKIEKLPKMQKSGFERLLQRIGGPLAAAAFVLIYWLCDFSFIEHIDPATLGKSAMARLSEVGDAGFIRINYAMMAVFVAAIILWITEAIPNYLTSLIVILTIVLTGITMSEVREGCCLLDCSL